LSLALHAASPSLYDTSVKALIEECDAALLSPVSLPLPKDGGGGYSHEKHKSNYLEMYRMSQAWTLTSDPKYAERARQMMLAYADFYPALPPHPITRSKQRGRLFFQTLNESVWLVHSAMAYETLRSGFDGASRKKIDALMREVASFIMEGTPANAEVFDSMHNHGTWALAAVGITGFAIGDKALVDKALYGTSPDGGGFLKQMDSLFSPDGYYTEGAYYQRYAMWPFFLFARELDLHMPELKVFERRNRILLKSVDALVNLSYEGVLLNFNDACPKTLNCQETVCALDIAYAADPSRKDLLWIADRYHDSVLPDGCGRAVSDAIARGEQKPYVFRSMLLRDGSEGKDGAYALLRSGCNSLLTMKATDHGMGHGHFDRLGILYYDNGVPVLTDYGSARFVNVDAKSNGGYTVENNTYAKTTVAHNTLVVDALQQYGGKWKASVGKSPVILGSDFSDPSFQYVGARSRGAWNGVETRRWVALAQVPFLQMPLVVDLVEALSDTPHVYDLPFHYDGEMISTNVPYKRNTLVLRPLGEDSGYQHLWLEAVSVANPSRTSYTWMKSGRMYTVSMATSASDSLYVLRTGATDPDFVLRSEPAVLLRRTACSTLFASCLESHGTYDLRTEQSSNLETKCTGIEVRSDSSSKAEIRYVFKDGSFTVLLDKTNNKMTIRYEQ